MEPDYDAIVFDNDGVLIELTDHAILAGAVHDTFAEFDVTVDDETVRAMVARDERPDQTFEDEYGIDPEQFWRRREANAAAVQRAAIRAGEKALYDDIDVLADFEQSLGVVSNNQHETITFILDYHDLGHHFETAYGRVPTLAGANRKKPDPSYIKQALEDLDTRNALYVGDSEKDVVAANRAGIDSAFLRREHRADLTPSVEPTYEFTDLNAMAKQFTGSQ